MPVAVFTEAQHAFDGLLGDCHQTSIDEVIVGASQTVLAGTVLGAIAVVADETISGAVGAGNVGTSPIGSLSATTNSINGVYQIILLSTGTTAEFEVQNPNGQVDGAGKIGTPYAGAIDFTITSGGTPTAGDQFTVTVTRPFDEGGEQFEAWSPTATDGSQVPVAIALAPATTGAGQTAKIPVLRRIGAFRLSAINWPVGATAGQKAFAQQQLAAKDILLR
jgi:Bacteriophage lambda head decoration protein D